MVKKFFKQVKEEIEQQEKWKKEQEQTVQQIHLDIEKKGEKDEHQQLELESHIPRIELMKQKFRYRTTYRNVFPRIDVDSESSEDGIIEL